MTELELAYITVHLFPTRQARDYFIAGFDGGLAADRVHRRAVRLETGSGSPPARPTSAPPIAVFLGQRAAVNNRPSVSLIDHRQVVKGRMAYRAVGGSGAHVGEEYYPNRGPPSTTSLNVE